MRPQATRNVDAAMDRGDPRRAGVGHNNPGGAEDRQPADDAEAAVERLRGQRLAVRDGDLHFHVARVAMRRGDFGDGLADHLTRHGIDRRLARRDGKPRPRHGADAFAGVEADAAAWRAGPHRRQDERAMGDVGIVARVLDHAGRGDPVAARRGGQRKGRALSARQGHLHGIGKRARQQPRIGRFGGRRGTGAGGPALAERAGGLVHDFRYRAPLARRHEGRAWS